MQCKWRGAYPEDLDRRAAHAHAGDADVEHDLAEVVRVPAVRVQAVHHRRRRASLVYGSTAAVVALIATSGVPPKP